MRNKVTGVVIDESASCPRYLNICFVDVGSLDETFNKKYKKGRLNFMRIFKTVGTIIVIIMI